MLDHPNNSAGGLIKRHTCEQGLPQKHEEMQQAIPQERILAHQRFRPHLWIIPEREIPSPIFVVAIFGEERFRRGKLAEGITTPPEQQEEKIIILCSPFPLVSNRPLH